MIRLFGLFSLVIQWNLYKPDTTGAKKKSLFYRAVRFTEIFSKIVWPQGKAIRSSSYSPSDGGVRSTVCPLYGDCTVFMLYCGSKFFKWPVVFRESTACFVNFRLDQCKGQFSSKRQNFVTFQKENMLFFFNVAI